MTVNFKPVCECGHIFKHFEYSFRVKELEEIYPDVAKEWNIHQRYYIRQSAISPQTCPNCGQVIEAFTIPDTRGSEIIYDEEETNYVL